MFNIVSYLIIIVFLITGAIATVRKRTDWLTWQLIACFSLGSFFVYVGTVMTAEKVTVLYAPLLLLLVGRGRIVGNLRRSGNGIIFIFALAVVVSVVMSYVIGVRQGSAVYSSGLQSPKLRPIVQAYTYISTLLIFPLAFVSLSTFKSVGRFFSVYAGTALASCVAAGIQLMMGNRFMPIYRPGGYNDPGAQFYMGDIEYSRLYGLAGEPKALASLLLPAFMMVLAVYSLRHGPRRRFFTHPILMIPFGIVLFLTFSTAGLLALGLAFAGLIVVAIRSGGASASKLIGGAAMVFVLLGAILPVVGKDVVSGTTGEPVDAVDVLYFRSVGRVQNEMPERLEYIAIRYILTEAPIAIPFGLGPGMYNFHDIGGTYAGGVVPMNSGWVTLFVDTGVLGVGALMIWMAAIISRGIRSIRCNLVSDPRTCGWLLLSMSALIGSLAMHSGTGALTSIMLFAGATEAIRRQVSLGLPRKKWTVGGSQESESSRVQYLSNQPHSSILRRDG